MKRRQRQKRNVGNQSAVKKPDTNVSTDFRSKIGAKLQTLLNGFTPDRGLTLRNRRQLYQDLFGEPQHSEIIIDPTIVIKSEPDEESSNDTTSFDSQNFLLSAKTRITELLNKKQDESNKHPFKDNEKENNVSSKGNASTSSSRNSSYTQTRAQSLLSNSFKKKRKLSYSRDNSSEPSTSKVRLKPVEVVVDDIKNSKDRTKSNQVLPADNLLETKKTSSQESSSSNVPENYEQSVDMVAEDNECNEVSDVLVVSPDIQSLIAAGPITSELDSEHFSIDKCNSSENNPQTSKSPEIATTSGYIPSRDPNLVPAVLPLGNILFDKSTDNFHCNIADNSELVDDPVAHETVLNVGCDSVKNIQEIHDPDVVLLCVKKPTHEVITLEDDDDSEDIIEEVHECIQCGKAFRAKSLLNFHIRMHGSDLPSSLPSSSQTCSALMKA